MTKKTDTLGLLTAMNQQQTQQFMAATLLAIAITMKKNGLTEMEISPNDYALLEQGETLEPVPTVAGGMLYKFVKVQPPLAKRVFDEPPVRTRPKSVTKTLEANARRAAKRADAKKVIL